MLTRTGSKMHLAYALELPDKLGPVQKQLNIAEEASFAFSIKNPEKGSPRDTGLDNAEKADYPDKLQKEFRDRKFATEDPHLLDYEGAQFILIGAGSNVKRDLGIDLEPEDKSEGTADIFKQLRLSKGKHPDRAAAEGRMALMRLHAVWLTGRCALWLKLRSTAVNSCSTCPYTACFVFPVLSFNGVCRETHVPAE